MIQPIKQSKRVATAAGDTLEDFLKGFARLILSRPRQAMWVVAVIGMLIAVSLGGYYGWRWIDAQFEVAETITEE